MEDIFLPKEQRDEEKTDEQLAGEASDPSGGSGNLVSD
jgi:hypothetical protein